MMSRGTDVVLPEAGRGVWSPPSEGLSSAPAEVTHWSDGQFRLLGSLLFTGP